jgi:hypothetical protein
VFALPHERTVAPGDAVPFWRVVFRSTAPWCVSFTKCRVTVYEHLDDTSSIGLGPRILGYDGATGQALPRNSSGPAHPRLADRTDHVLHRADGATC